MQWEFKRENKHIKNNDRDNCVNNSCTNNKHHLLFFYYVPGTLLTTISKTQVCKISHNLLYYIVLKTLQALFSFFCINYTLLVEIEASKPILDTDYQFHGFTDGRSIVIWQMAKSILYLLSQD